MEKKNIESGVLALNQRASDDDITAPSRAAVAVSLEGETEKRKKGIPFPAQIGSELYQL